jgi:hypothetical protein
MEIERPRGELFTDLDHIKPPIPLNVKTFRKLISYNTWH